MFKFHICLLLVFFLLWPRALVQCCCKRWYDFKWLIEQLPSVCSLSCVTSRALQVSQALMGQLENLDPGEAKGPQDLRDYRDQQESQWVGTYHQLLLLLIYPTLLVVWMKTHRYFYLNTSVWTTWLTRRHDIKTKRIKKLCDHMFAGCSQGAQGDDGWYGQNILQ